MFGDLSSFWCAHCMFPAFDLRFQPIFCICLSSSFTSGLPCSASISELPPSRLTVGSWLSLIPSCEACTLPWKGLFLPCSLFCPTLPSYYIQQSMTSEVEKAVLNATQIFRPVPVGWSVYSRNCNYLCLATGEPRSVPFHYVPPSRAFLWRVVRSVLRPFRLFLTSEDAVQQATNLVSLSVLTKEVVMALLYKRSIRRSFMVGLLIQHVLMICMVRVWVGPG